ncbi:hypothetical protein TWF506_005541 [Arthrobotrys conoides]|uniref:Uncharacterized protein n=1 Tax=Arthrobotrys conoides TaxID=74498 RepID=A0AAN8RPY4_9PEZI
MAHPLSWRSLAGSPSHYHRSFDPLEKYEYYMSTMNPTIRQRAVVAGVTLSSSSPFSSLSIKSAWKSLRYAHPILGCKITPDGFDFQVQSSTEIDEWVESTVKTIHPQEAKEGEGQEQNTQTIKLFSSNPPYPQTAELYYSPTTNDLFIQIRHEIVDGVGSIMLLNNFLTLLFSPSTPSSPQSSNQTDNPSLLSPSLSEITKTPPPTPEIIQKHALLVKSFLSSPPISLPLNSSPTHPYESHRYDYSFTNTQSSLLLKTCKYHGITITHAVTASAALSILKLTNQDSGVISSTFPMSLRDTLPAPYNSPTYAALLCITSPLPALPVTPSTTLISLSKMVKKEYDDWKNNKENIQYHEPQIKMVEQAIKADSTSKNSAGSATVVVSSLGIVEKYLTIANSKNEDDRQEENGGRKVKDFWIGQVQGNPKVTLFVYTFEGKIRLAACYNRRFHEDKDVQEFVRVVVETVYEGLGIDEDIL